MADTEWILKAYTRKQSNKQTQMKMLTVFISFTELLYDLTNCYIVHTDILIHHTFHDYHFNILKS